MTTTLTLRPISAAEHRDFITGQSSASFLQTPAWASVKSEWRNDNRVLDELGVRGRDR